MLIEREDYPSHDEDEDQDAVISRQGRRCEGHLIRIHRSMIVNVDRVRELKPAFHGEFVVFLHGGTRLRCSRAYAERLTKAMGS